MSVDKFKMGNTTDPATEAYAVTPSNSVDLTYTSRSLYIGTAGDVTVDMYGPTGGADAMARNVATQPITVTFVNVQAGTILPICVRRVRATGTTATNIVSIL